MSLNRCMLVGNLTREVEVKQTQSGTSILRFGIAVNDRVKNQQTGEWTDRPNYVDCIMFGRRAESLSRLLRKGQKVAIEGKLRYSSWEDKQGQKRSKIEVAVDEVELMSQRNGSQSQQDGSYAPQQQQQANYSQQQQYAPQNGYQQPTGGYQQYNQPQQTGGYGNLQMPDVYDSDMPFGG